MLAVPNSHSASVGTYGHNPLLRGAPSHAVGHSGLLIDIGCPSDVPIEQTLFSLGEWNDVQKSIRYPKSTYLYNILFLWKFLRKTYTCSAVNDFDNDQIIWYFRRKYALKSIYLYNIYLRHCYKFYYNSL